MALVSYFSTFSNDCYAALLEFIGTFVFLLLGLGGIQAAATEQSNDGGKASGLEYILYVATSMSLSLLVSVWLFFRVTGGVFNPNVSLALLLTGAIKPVRFVLYCVAQLLGSTAASGLVLSLTSSKPAFKLSHSRTNPFAFQAR
jgi:aquaporin related protein